MVAVLRNSAVNPSPVPMLLSIPYEEGTYWRKGAKHGCKSVLDEFNKIRPVSVATGRSLPWTCEQLDGGCLELDPYNRELGFDIIQASIQAALTRGRPPVAIGGDHSITIPILRAFAEVYGQGGFSVIHIDAHSDTFPPVNGYRFHHGAVFRVAIEEGLIRAEDLVQLGLRGAVRDGGLEFAHANGIRCVTADEWRKAGFAITSYVRDRSKPCYVSIDIDAVDPAYAPGTGTPVPGGLTSAEILNVVREIGELPLIGADLVEVAPVFDTSGITSLLAAHILFELLTHASFSSTGKSAVYVTEKENSC